MVCFKKQVRKVSVEHRGDFAYSLGNIITWSLTLKPGYRPVVDQHARNYPTTLASDIIEYAKDDNTTGHQNRLKNIYENIIKPKLSYTSKIYVHLRLGDCSISRRVVDKNKITYVENPVNTTHFKNTVLDIYKHNQTTCINFVTGVHNHKDLKNNKYLQKGRPGQGSYDNMVEQLETLKTFLEDNCITYDFTINNHPDDDFLNMVGCKQVVTTYGSFGKYVRMFRALGGANDDISLCNKNVER